MCSSGISGSNKSKFSNPQLTSITRLPSRANCRTDVAACFSIKACACTGSSSNLNTSAIGGYDRPSVRLPGSGGANDIISLCRSVIILTAHEPRRFVEKVDFVTSPGYLAGGDSRARCGLLFGGVSRVVTTLGLFGFEPASRRMRLEALHPGVSVDQVRARTPFELLVAERVETTAAPSAQELEILRALDPARQFIG